jgi:NAD(P)-dependent dehydrogenase (short-subunit alcohol dehydrogenase family)
MGRLDNKVALITGAGSGMGQASAILFCKEGAKVAVADLSVEGGNETVRMIKETSGEAIFVKVDVTKATEVEKMVKTTVDTYGRLDILFNNAGILVETASMVDFTEENWDKQILVNLKGVWLGMKYAIPEMLKAGGGSIINMGSSSALQGMEGVSAYSASKGGVAALTRAAAKENFSNNIRVNCIHPSSIYSKMMDEWEEKDAESFKRFVAVTPWGRLGKPEEIAQVALFLASDESSFINGAGIVADAGLIMAFPKY